MENQSKKDIPTSTPPTFPLHTPRPTFQDNDYANLNPRIDGSERPTTHKSHYQNAKRRPHMVAVDGSEVSDLAFHHALKHSSPRDRILVVCGFNHSPGESTKADSDPNESNEIRHDKANSILEPYREKCKKFKRTCTFQTLPYSGGASSLGEAICREAAINRVDTLTLGSRGLSRVQQFILGSVGSYCANHCPCNVTIVKPIPEKITKLKKAEAKQQ